MRLTAHAGRPRAQGGADRGADTGKPAVKSRLKTGDFALEGSAAARRSAEERLQEIHCRRLSSWAEDGTCWRADPAEEELPIFDAPATTADTRVASRRQRYLYKDVISVVPSSEELEAMREVQEESEQAEEVGGSSDAHGSPRHSSASATTGSGLSDSSDDGDCWQQTPLTC